MLDMSVTPFRLIGKIGREKVEDQPYEFSGSKCEGSFMLMGSYFLIFFPVIFPENRITSSYSISCFNEIISEVFIRGAGHSFLLGFKSSCLILWPDEPRKFSELIMGLKFFDISNFSDNSCGKYFTNAWDSGKSIRERFKLFRYSFINFLKTVFKGSDSADEVSKDEGNSFGEFGTEAIRFSDCFLDKVGEVMRVRASIFTFLRDKRSEFTEGKTDEFLWRERGKQSRDSMTSEGFHRFSLDYCRILEKEIREEGINFSDNSFHKMISIASEGFKRRIWVMRDMRKRKSPGESEVMGDSNSIGFISFIKFWKRFTEAIQTKSIKSINFGGERGKPLRIGEEIRKMPIVDTCGFSSNKDRRDRFSSIVDKFKKEVKEGLSSGRSIGKTLGLRDCITYFVDNKRDKLIGIYIQTNKKRTHCFTSFSRKVRGEEGSWLPGYRAASRMSTLKVQRSVSRSYPGPGGLTFKSKLKCKEDKPISVISPSKGVFTRILPFLQYKVNLSLS